MRRLLVLLLIPGCNAIFGLEEPVGGELVDGAPPDAAAFDGPDVDAPDPQTTCGDGDLDPGEACDDRNRISWDGCNDFCQFEHDVGCADGSRDGFDPGVANIAACGGGFSQAGLTAPFVITAPCADSGDDGPNAEGLECAAINLCANGWHICQNLIEVQIAASGAACGVGFEPGFYATNQGVTADVVCTALMGVDGIVGCGDLGAAADGASCASLTRAAGSRCLALGGGWSCADPSSERTTVTKSAAAGGGVLCCR